MKKNILMLALLAGLTVQAFAVEDFDFDIKVQDKTVLEKVQAKATEVKDSVVRGLEKAQEKAVEVKDSVVRGARRLKEVVVNGANKAVDMVKENPKTTIAVAVGVAATAVGGYLVYRHYKNKKAYQTLMQSSVLDLP